MNVCLQLLTRSEVWLPSEEIQEGCLGGLGLSTEFLFFVVCPVFVLLEVECDIIGKVVLQQSATVLAAKKFDFCSELLLLWRECLSVFGYDTCAGRSKVALSLSISTVHCDTPKSVAYLSGDVGCIEQGTN